MKSKRGCRSSLTFPSSMFALGVGILCVVYIQTSHSASITVSSNPKRSSSPSSSLDPVVATANTSSPSSPPAISHSAKSPSRITTLKARLDKQKSQRKAVSRAEAPPQPPQQPGRMKASDIKACISRAFCEVNSASKVPNYAVNKEFFDLMNQIHAMSAEDVDSGSTSVEYDEEEEDEEEDDDASSEESSSSERLRGRGYPPPPPGYRFSRNLKNGDNSTLYEPVNGKSNSTTASSTKVKGSKKPTLIKKSGNKTKVTGKKTQKKYKNGTLLTGPKRRRTRVEAAQEKAQQEAYLTRKQREMGQVNDLAALIRISADIGLTLRNPRKCRTLFNKCTMEHEQIVDLFNQTLMAVTTPATLNNAPDLSSHSAAPYTVPTTKRAKVTSTTTLAATSTSPTLSPSKPPSTSASYYSELPSISVSTAVHSKLSHAPPTPLFVTTQAPRTTTQDDNRSSKSRHDFSDEDVEYLTDTDLIQPVQTYALFVNDAPEDSVKTAEEVNVQETFKKYANAFPAESPLPGDLPSLRERDDKKKSSTVNGSGRSSKIKLLNKRGKPSSEEEDDDDDDDEDDMGSVSLENRSGYHSSRIEPYQGYRDMQDMESGETASLGKESSEGILPPLVQKVKPTKPVKDEDEEDDEDDSDESAEADVDEGHIARSKPKGKKKGGAKPVVEDDESSEEDDIEVAEDDHQAPAAPWTPNVYQMHKGEKVKKGNKKRQKGPYKGGEGPYDDIPHPGMPPAPSHSSGGVISSALNSLKKPWGSSSSVSQEVGQDQAPHHHHYPSSHSQELPYGDAPYHHGGGPPPSALPYGGGGPHPSSQEIGAEQKPGFFQSIMSWFTGSKGGEQGAQHQADGPYGPGPQGPYGDQPPYSGGGSGEHHHHHRDDHNDRDSATGAPWPSQPDPAGVGQFGQSYAYRYRDPAAASSEEDSFEEMLIEEPIKQKKKNKRRFRGRSDSIITAPPKKTSPAKKGKNTGGPPPPVVIVPKKSTKPSSHSSGGIGAFEPNLHYEKLIQADGGLSSGGKKNIKPSDKEYKRTKKAAIKPKSNQNQTPSSSSSTKKKQKKSTQKRGSRESNEDDDDEVYSSEEIYNQHVAKLKTGGSMEIVSLGGGSSSSNGANNGGSSSSNKNSNKNGYKQQTNSFPNYFESMFGTEEKDKHAIKGKDDGSLLYGFDALSSTLNASPLELPAVTMKKTASTYKVNKNKKKQKKKGNSPPVKFNNKEAIRESSEEDDKKK